MRTIRRLYLYVVSFISLEVVLWGLVGLARSAFTGDQIGSGVSQLASALSLIIVGVPVFLLHWWLAQRNVQADDEERFARLRAVFLYGALLATLIPITQNTLALINRLWLQIFDLSTQLAIFGETQTWADNLIAIAMNGLIAAYIFSVLRQDWDATPVGNSFPETRRLYRYIWKLYGLAMMVGGLQQVLQYILDIADTFGGGVEETLANGLALLIVGTPLWIFVWRLVQKSLAQPDERQSVLRMVVLYGLSLIGIGGVLIPAGMVLDVILLVVFGESMTLSSFLSEVNEPLSALIPFGGMWVYYGHTLKSAVSSLPASPRRAGLRRVYFYILAFVGLVSTFFGLNALLSFMVDTLIQTVTWEEVLRSRLAASLATLLVGLPLWVLTWRPMITEASQEGEAGDHARRSLVRKIYLYLALFAGVMGIMVSAGALIFQLLRALLGDPADNFQRASLMLLELLVLLILLSVYHWTVLRADGRMAERSLAARHAEFPVLVLITEIGDDFSESMTSALQREAASLPVAVHPVANGIPDETLSEARVVIVPGELAATPPEAIRLWLQGFSGIRLAIPTPTDGWFWVFGSGRAIPSLARQTAKMVHQLAEGEDIPKIRETSAWMIILYVLGGLIGIPLVFSLLAMLAELFY
ncbi:MAG: hypothetical protein KJ638_06255 [Chloroflexi bacterium]|nr:hypothetical protein [Chloroflexota bacterium]